MMDNIYNIFYTDDDADDREVFKEVVSEIHEGMYIFTQSDGEELMSMLHDPPPHAHLIFLDLNMPQMNGYEVLKEIRKTEKMKHLPVIIFSTSINEESIKETKRLGATLYVNKPNSYAELKKLLRELLSKDWDNYNSAENEFVYTM